MLVLEEIKASLKSPYLMESQRPALKLWIRSSVSVPCCWIGQIAVSFLKEDRSFPYPKAIYKGIYSQTFLYLHLYFFILFICIKCILWARFLHIRDFSPHISSSEMHGVGLYKYLVFHFYLLGVCLVPDPLLGSGYPKSRVYNLTVGDK